jgi:tmRNA-binding protein
VVDTNENIRLIIFKNGNFTVKTEWREENHMDFTKIVTATSAKINPIIKQINNLGENVKYHKVTIPELTKNNMNFTETAVSFYYDDDVTEAKFDVFKSILDDCREIGILSPKENLSLGVEYFFNKGMYLYDASRIEKTINVDNYYEFLSNAAVKQKWNTLFMRTRLFQIINVSSKIKINISGIRDDVEMDNFHMYLKAFLSIYQDNTKNMKIESNKLDFGKKNSLKSLRVQDPLLYDFKKIYKSNVIYAKICQKPHQPVILSDADYDKLPKDQKNKALKYWNYTTQKPVWYSCPNPKFPYIKFHVKQHPKDFCIPCCKKIEMGENVNIKKQEIHNTCMDKHIYSGEKVNLTKGSHYIASYGKNIEPGRISRLPEHTLEPLFFDTYSINDGIDQECVTTDGYYLYGVEQNAPALKNVGMLYIMSNVLNYGIVEFVNECGVRFKKENDSFRALLDGTAGLYFADINDVYNQMLELINPNTVSSISNIPWNQLIINIAYYYFGINTILFEDTNKESIDMVLPKGLKSYIEMFPESHKNIIVLHKQMYYYPIYLFNTEIFKRTGIIDTKIFINESGLMAIIKSIVKKSLESQDFSTIKFHIELNAVKEFCKFADKTIDEYYINYSNMCYAVIIEGCYFPITPSHYPLEQDIVLKFDHYTGITRFDKLQNLIASFKKWNTYVSKKNGLDGIFMYPTIDIEQWLEYKDNIIGFVSNNINYYTAEMKVAAAKKHKDAPVQKLLYHPQTINKLICSVKKGKTKTEHNMKYNDKLNKSLYNYYIYELLLLHFIKEFNSHRNTSFRNKINMIISKTNFSKNVTEVRELIDSIDDVEDVHKIKNLINKFITIHHDKKQLLADISNTYFNFDKVALEVLRGKNIKDITAILTKIANKFVKISNVNIVSFPNMITACDSKISTDYCSGDKLLITKKTLTELISIIASDAADPEKWKWIFNSAFIARSVDYFKFIRRNNEYITIEFVN